MRKLAAVLRCRLNLPLGGTGVAMRYHQGRLIDHVYLGVADLAAGKSGRNLCVTNAVRRQLWNWLILKNGQHAIGLFQGTFEANILTFNPGWDSDAQPLEEFTDVRVLQRQLKDHGVTVLPEADESTTGPASFMIVDPDGNTILVDQHI